MPPTDRTTVRWADHDGLRLHYLDSGGDGRPPLLFIPGFGEEADEHRPLIARVAPRRVLVPDLRGRGRSDVPADAWDLEDHVADIEAVVASAGVDRVHLATYSRGTGYGLGWALRHPEQVCSLVVGEYPARHIVPPAWFAAKVAKSSWRGRPVAERMAPEAIAAMAARARPVEFWDDLGRLTCPVMLVRGGAPGAIVDDALERRWREALPDIEVERFEQSGHDLWHPDPHRYADLVARFTARPDAAC